MNQLDQIGKSILDSAFQVHKALGPGLLECTYEACLAYELVKRGYHVERQKSLPVVYGEIKLDAGYRLDLLINDSVIIEAKAVETILPIHQAQLQTYLKLSKLNLGYLINFNVPLIKNGIQRHVLNFQES